MFSPHQKAKQFKEIRALPIPKVRPILYVVVSRIEG